MRREPAAGSVARVLCPSALPSTVSAACAQPRPWGLAGYRAHGHELDEAASRRGHCPGRWVLSVPPCFAGEDTETRAQCHSRVTYPLHLV